MIKAELSCLGLAVAVTQVSVLLLARTRFGKFVTLPLFRFYVAGEGTLSLAVVRRLVDSGEYAVWRPALDPDGWEGMAIVRRVEGRDPTLPVVTFSLDRRGCSRVMLGTLVWPWALLFAGVACLTHGLSLVFWAFAIGIIVSCAARAVLEAERIRLRLLDAFWA